MNKIEINEFIERMEEINDIWEPEDVERVYGDVSLEEALRDRRGLLDMFFGNIAKILNS